MLQNIITNLPNFAVALVMLWWQKQTIDQLLAVQEKLIERLLAYVDNDKREAAQILSVVKGDKADKAA